MSCREICPAPNSPPPVKLKPLCHPTTENPRINMSTPAGIAKPLVPGELPLPSSTSTIEALVGSPNAAVLGLAPGCVNPSMVV